MYFLYTVNKTITFSHIAEASWILPYDLPASSGAPLFFGIPARKLSKRLGRCCVDQGIYL